MRNAIDIAREAGLLTWLKPPEDVIERLKRFEALVRADERESCAKVCEEEALLWPPSRDFKLCAAAIRARGQA
jgi:hypothetical protein